MTVKLNTPVSYNGEITTINELDKKGLIEYKEIKNFYTPRNGLQTKYFADINLGIKTGWK